MRCGRTRSHFAGPHHPSEAEMDASATVRRWRLKVRVLPDGHSAGSSNGRTAVFGAAYAGSSPALATRRVRLGGQDIALSRRERGFDPRTLHHGAVVERYNARLSTGRTRVRSPSAPRIGLEVVWKTTRLLSGRSRFESGRANNGRTAQG